MLANNNHTISYTLGLRKKKKKRIERVLVPLGILHDSPRILINEHSTYFLVVVLDILYKIALRFTSVGALQTLVLATVPILWLLHVIVFISYLVDWLYFKIVH